MQHALAVEPRILAGAPVASLLLCRNPFAVGALVIAVAVDALKGVTLWTLAHVDQEVLKRTPTRIADNTASAIVLEVRVVWIEATSTHHCPCDIFRRARAPVRQARACLAVKAAARARAPASDLIAGRGCETATIADTRPLRLAFDAASVSNHA